MSTPTAVATGDTATFRRLEILAWANVGLHALGLTVAWFGLRPGSVVAPLAERMAYLAADPAIWRWGWGLFMLCTLVLVAYMAVLERLMPPRSTAARLALVLTASGMAIDLLCDVLQISVLPLAAAAGPASPSLFLAVERLAFTGGATAANGLYTTGVLLMTLRLGRRAGAPARLAGYATVAAGYAMAVAGLLPSPALLQAAAGPTLGFYCLWTVLLARDLRRQEPNGTAS
jgi:hypothetical protein